jgi:GntR family transcriptional regulator/MocR family aminotransferase
MSSLGETPFNPTLDAPLYQQLYMHLRSAILTGRLKRGLKLPSTRAFADELKVSRNTVLNAYSQLLAEGYLESVEAKGTFVASVLPDAMLSARPTLPHSNASQPANIRRPSLSKTAETLIATPTTYSLPQPRNTQGAFTVGIPALDTVPVELWGKLVAHHAKHTTTRTLSYQDSAGYRPLREAIADHVTVTRRVRCAADQIIVVSGSQGALDLVARVLLNPGDPVWMEDPGYLGARGAFLGVGAQLVPIPVDNDGLVVDNAIARCPDAKLAYLTPSHQFPLGVTMSLSRRLAILDWASRAGAYIIEDDYDSEYRFHGHPLAALQGLDEANCVIYVGTFSKTLFPSMRLGYLILPPALIGPFLAVKWFIDIHPPVLEQIVLADFIARGYFSRHLRRTRTLYAERRATLLDAMADLPLEMYAADTGLHCLGWLPDGINDQVVAAHANAHDVDVFPLSKFAIAPQPRHALLLGYGAVDNQQIRPGVRRLAAALKETGTIT